MSYDPREPHVPNEPDNDPESIFALIARDQPAINARAAGLPDDKPKHRRPPRREEQTVEPRFALTDDEIRDGLKHLAELRATWAEQHTDRWTRTRTPNA